MPSPGGVRPPIYGAVTPTHWTCKRCKNENPAGAPTCICGEAAPVFTGPNSTPAARRYPIWLAALPALLLPLFFASQAALQFSHAARAINPNASFHKKSNQPACVDTYGITLNLSELYAREWAPGIAAGDGPNQPKELSTVVRGMARNNCGEEVKNVHLRFVVHDDDGKRGEGTLLIENLAIGEVKAFERAWMGRVTSYEVTADQ